MTPIDRITERVNRGGEFYTVEKELPMLTLEEFFEGNAVDGSIMCNVTPTPSPATVYKIFNKMRQIDGIVDIRVQITEFDDPSWPFSDTVWVIGTAATESILAQLPEALLPDEVFNGWIEGNSREMVEVPENCCVIGLWWD